MSVTAFNKDQVINWVVTPFVDAAKKKVTDNFAEEVALVNSGIDMANSV